MSDASTRGTGELPVSGSPVRATPETDRPSGPHLPTVLSGLAVLALTAITFVWRLVDAPDRAVVGIGIGAAAGVLLLAAAAVSFVTQHAHGRTP